MCNDQEWRYTNTALIFTGGEWHEDACRALLRKVPFRPCCTIAADIGYQKASRVYEGRIDLLVGDFDSLGENLPRSVEICRVPCEKDVTDTMLACEKALERGAQALWILGGTGGRVDHSLSNILYLERLRNRGIPALLTDGENRVRVCRDETIVLPDRGGYFSVLALDTCEVTLTGCKYPLRNAKLCRENPYAVSNEVLPGGKAEILLSGTAILVESVK